MTILFDGAQVTQYAALQIAGTDYLGFRDLVAFAYLHQVSNERVLDLGCGAEHLLIVQGTKHLYTQSFCTIKGVGKLPVSDGDLCAVELTDVSCLVEDYYWGENIIIQLAESVGFNLVGVHYPLGSVNDQQPYQDEYLFPPFYYLCFKQ